MTARKVRLADITNGRYFAGSKEEMKASYIISPLGQKVSRASIVATVIDKFESDDGKYSSVTVDDGTDVINVRAFGEDVAIFEGKEIGDLVLVIGKVKEYNGELYLNGEVIRKVEPNFEMLRKLEVLDELLEAKKIVKEITELKEKLTGEELANNVSQRYGMDKECLSIVLDNLKVKKEVDYRPKILELISSLDEGDGVEMSKLLGLSDLPENIIEKAMNNLLSSGSVYEPYPGKFKVV